MTPGSELWRGANWWGCKRRLIVLCRKSGARWCLQGHWSLIIIFPRAFDAFSEKGMLIEGLFSPGSYREDVCWHVQRGGPISDKLVRRGAAKWRQAIYIVKLQLVSDLDLDIILIASTNLCNVTSSFHEMTPCKSENETHPAVKIREVELFWRMILGLSGLSCIHWLNMTHLFKSS